MVGLSELEPAAKRRQSDRLAEDGVEDRWHGFAGYDDERAGRRCAARPVVHAPVKVALRFSRKAFMPSR